MTCTDTEDESLVFFIALITLINRKSYIRKPINKIL